MDNGVHILMASSYKSWLTFTASQNYFNHIWSFSVLNQPVFNSSNWCGILQYFPIGKSQSVFLETVFHWSLMFLHLLLVLSYVLRDACILNKLEGRINLPLQSASIFPSLFNAAHYIWRYCLFLFCIFMWGLDNWTPTSPTQTWLIVWLLLLL